MSLCCIYRPHPKGRSLKMPSDFFFFPFSIDTIILFPKTTSIGAANSDITECVSFQQRVCLTNIKVAVELQFCASLWRGRSDLSVLAIELQRRLLDVLFNLHTVPFIII